MKCGGFEYHLSPEIRGLETPLRFALRDVITGPLRLATLGLDPRCGYAVEAIDAGKGKARRGGAIEWVIERGMRQWNPESIGRILGALAVPPKALVNMRKAQLC